MPATMDSLSLLLPSSIFFITIFLIFISKRNPKPSKQPPGPIPYPIIGNLLQLGNNPLLAFTKLSKIYGPIISLKLGNITTIVISSPELAKEAFHQNDLALSDRTVPDAVRALDHCNLTLPWQPVSAHQWRSQRKACATNIFSPQRLESTQILRQRKVQDLLDYVQESYKKGEALHIGESAFIAILNSLSNTLFAVDLAGYASDKSQDFKEIVLGIVEEVGRPNISDFFPIFRVFDLQGVRGKMKKYFERLIVILDGIMEERLRLRGLNMDSKECCECALDFFLDLTGDESSGISRSEVLHLFMDLFVAGIDTTASTLEWSMAELLKNPEKLAKAKQEIHQVIGKDEQLEESHISKLPFLRAVVKETLRMHPPAPLLLPHKAANDVEISGFTIPKGTQILANVWAMGRDSSIWENPNLFVPERFLKSKVDFKGRDFNFIPFGAGRRICPGLPLASRAVSFMLVSLLFHYDWKLADELKPEDMDMSEKYGITIHRVQPLRVIPIKG